MTRREKIVIFLLTVGLALLWNWHFAEWAATPRVLEMNDVGGIMTGYKQTPHLFPDSHIWWHSSWIQEDTHVFRPVSSYLLWMESCMGLKWGFYWIGCIGFLLFLGNCLLTTALSWRFTRSKVCVLLSCILVPAITYWNWGGSQPYYWLVWYPVHHDLLMIGFLLGALLSFDLWLETQSKKHLVCTWLCFGLGALSKEFVYIFPIMAAALVIGKPHYMTVSRKTALMQVGFMVLTTIVLFCYRTSVLIDAYNPPRLKKYHFIRKPFLYWWPSFYKYIPAEIYWYPGLAVLLLTISGTLVKLYQSRWRSSLTRQFAWLPISVSIAAIFCIYCALAHGSPVEALWFIFDVSDGWLHLSDLIQMIFTLYSWYLLWKYRKQEPTGATVALLILSYMPVFTYLGWHYTLAGWFVRCAFYWPVVAKLVWIDLGRPRWKFPVLAAAK